MITTVDSGDPNFPDQDPQGHQQNRAPEGGLDQGIAKKAVYVSPWLQPGIREFPKW